MIIWIDAHLSPIPPSHPLGYMRKHSERMIGLIHRYVCGKTAS